MVMIDDMGAVRYRLHFGQGCPGFVLLLHPATSAPSRNFRAAPARSASWLGMTVDARYVRKRRLGKLWSAEAALRAQLQGFVQELQ